MAANNGQKQSSDMWETIKKTSATLKRHPKMELSKPDLLQLLGILEGELQAREIVIAALKSEQVKQLLYPKKRSSAAAGDAWSALRRDCQAAFDTAFDEASVKNLYGMQLSQLDSFLKQYRVVQMKLRQQLQEAEDRCQKLMTELELERCKYAQDTAQGDDVTYLLEKERERLHHENEIEKQRSRAFEKELKFMTDKLEQEQQRQKQIVLLLLADRKKLIFQYAEEKQKSDRLSQILCDEKGRIADMVDGLEEESKKSLQMEAELERQQCEFDFEREQHKADLSDMQRKNNDLQEQIQRLQEEVQRISNQAALGEGVRSTIVSTRPSLSPPRSGRGTAPATPAKPPGLVPQGKLGKQPSSTSAKLLSPKPANVSPATLPSPENAAGLLQAGTELSESEASKIYSAVKVSQPVATPKPSTATAPVSVRKPSLGRGQPPPIPPNKPVLAPQALLNRRESTGCAKPPVPPRSDAGPKQPGAKGSSEEAKEEATPTSSEVLDQELADFQQVLVSMATTKAANSVVNSAAEK